MSIVKLTTNDMRAIATAGHSAASDFMNSYSQLVNVAEELATTHMQGSAGPAVHVKAMELKADVDRHTQMAQEKFQGISQFADRTEEAEMEKHSKIMATTSL